MPHIKTELTNITRVGMSLPKQPFVPSMKSVAREYGEDDIKKNLKEFNIPGPNQTERGEEAITCGSKSFVAFRAQIFGCFKCMDKTAGLTEVYADAHPKSASFFSQSMLTLSQK